MYTPSPNTPPSPGVLKKLVLAAVLVLCVLTASIYSVGTKKQLGLLDGMVEEYMELAINLHQTGKYNISPHETKPFFFRPPGYVKFLDLVFSSYSGVKFSNRAYTSVEDFETENRTLFYLVYVWQSFVLAAAALVMFLYLGQLISIGRAFVLALVFGINPYMVIYVGLVHYTLLHIFFVLLSTWLMHNAIIRQEGPAKIMLWLAAGACWGITTLIRPLSLILPALLAAGMAWQHRKTLKKAAVQWLLFTTAFACAVLPWTWRNYQLAHKIVPVNAQAYVNFWGTSDTVLKLYPNHYRWWMQVWNPGGQQIYESVVGKVPFNTTLNARYNLELEDAFQARFKSNLASKPQVYLTNVCGNAVLMTFATNAVFVKAFQYLQHSRDAFTAMWLRPGDPQDFYSSTGSNVCTIFMLLLALVGYAGAVFAFMRKDPGIMAPLCGFATLVIGHSISYTDLMYYYARVPFLFIFAALALCHAVRLPARFSKIVQTWSLPVLLAGTVWFYWLVILA